MDIYLGRDDQQAGPFTPDKIEELIRTGAAAKTDMIWHAELPCWSCLGVRPEYQALFAEAEKAAAAEAKTLKSSSTPPPLHAEVGTQQQPSNVATATTVEAPSEPKKYRPGMGQITKKNVDQEDEDAFAPYVQPVEPATRGSRLMAVTIDGLALTLCFWLLGAVMLPKGMSFFDFYAWGDSYENPMYEDREFASQVRQLDQRYETEADFSWAQYDKAYEKLETEWQSRNGVNWDAGDRWEMGTSTGEDWKSIGIYFLAAAALALVFYIFQFYFVATKGQSLGKMFMDIKIVLEPSNEKPGFVKGVLLRTIAPGAVTCIPFIGGIFGLVDMLMIFNSDQRCLHDKWAGTVVVKTR